MTSEQTHDPSESMSGTRRHLIRAAAGGFALAASGLVLPDWREEAEAREGHHGGALGGRHGQNQRGRDKHKPRDHGKKKDKHQDQDKPRGHLDFRGVAISVHNYRSVPVQVRGWRYDYRRGEFLVPTGWEATIPGRGADGSHSVRDFKTNIENVAVQIGTDRVVHCINRVAWFPFAAMGTEGLRNGAGIINTGTVNLTGCTIRDNIASGQGGGIHNTGTLTLDDCDVADNRAEGGDGGGIRTGGGTVTLNGGSVTGNFASGDGGGSFNFSESGTVTLNNCTVTDNDPNDCAGNPVVGTCGA